MVTFLLVVLALLDFALISAILMLRKRQVTQISMIEDLTEERKMLSELRCTIQDELEIASSKNKENLNKVTHLAAEAEQEIKAGSDTLSKEMEKILLQLSSRFEEPLKELTKKQAAIEMLAKRIEEQKVILHKLVTRGEKVCQILDKKAPYQDVLSEIEDKKYSDARHLIAKGISPQKVAHELGLTESEVRLVAGLAL